MELYPRYGYWTTLASNLLRELSCPLPCPSLIIGSPSMHSAGVELASNDEHTLTFTLPTDGVGLGFFMDTQLDSLNISSSMQVGNQNAARRGFVNIDVFGIVLLATAAAVQFM